MQECSKVLDVQGNASLAANKPKEIRLSFLLFVAIFPSYVSSLCLESVQEYA